MPVAKEEEDPDAIQVKSGELMPASVAPPAPTSPRPRSPLADLDLSSLETEGEVPEQPPAKAPSVKPAPAPPKPKPAPEVKKGTRTWAFDADKDEGKSIELVSGYTLKYMDKSAGNLEFRLKGKDTHSVILGLDESKTVDLESPDGPISVKLTNAGLNKEGNMEITVEWEGGKTKAAKTVEKAKEKVSATGRKTLSGIAAHSNEISALVVAAAVPVVYAIGGQPLRDAMGQALYYVLGAGVTVSSAALVVWQWIGRSKEIREDNAQSGPDDKQRVN